MASNSLRGAKIGLLAGYLALFGAVVVARNDPASGYELSPYAATPAAVWAGLAVALAAGVVVAFAVARGRRAHDAAVLLVAGAAVSLLTMPILRGYHFYGGGDSLSHVGWAREIAAGSLDPASLLYPGMHTATVVVGAVADVSLLRANTYVVLVAFPLVFLLCLPLAVQLLARTPRAYAVGLFAAALFTPINNIAVHPVAHAASQAILLSAFPLYLALAYVARGRDGRAAGWRSWVPRAGRATGLGAVLAGASVAMVLVHPQQALNLTLCFVAVAAGQVLLRRWAPGGVVPTDRLLHVQAAVVVVAFLAWAPRFERVQGAVVSTLVSVVSESPTGTVVTEKSASLTTIGGSLPVLFAKLFLAPTVVSALAAGVILLAVRRRLADEGTATLVTYVAAALVPVVGVFLLVYASSAGDMYFRYQGFIMVPVTVLGAAALALALDRANARTRRAGTAVAVVLFLVLLPAAAVATHPSPYLYQPSRHVTEAHTDGYAASFDQRQEGVAFAGLRGGPRRFVDLHYGTQQARTTLEFPGYETGVPPSVFERANYTDYFEEPHYLEASPSTYEKEVALYDGFRYGSDGFRALETTPGVNRVRSSDGFTLYRIDPGGEDAE